jgi:hypothetical protein
LNPQLQNVDIVIYSTLREGRNQPRRNSGIFAAIVDFAAILIVDRGEHRSNGSDAVSFEFRRIALKEHKFQIGQSVYFTSRPIGHMAANSTYQVVKLLPSDGADYQYRIKNANEAFERVVRESQLEYSR